MTNSQFVFFFFASGESGVQDLIQQFEQNNVDDEVQTPEVTQERLERNAEIQDYLERMGDSDMKERRDWLQNFLVHRPYAPEEYCRNYANDAVATEENCPGRYCKMDGTECKKKYDLDPELIKQDDEIKSLPGTFYDNIDFDTDTNEERLSLFQDELRYFCRSLYLEEVELTDNISQAHAEDLNDGTADTITLNDGKSFCTWPNGDETQKRCESHEGENKCNEIIEQQSAAQSHKLCKWNEVEEQCQTSEKSGLFGSKGSGLMLGRGADFTLDDYDELLKTLESPTRALIDVSATNPSTSTSTSTSTSMSTSSSTSMSTSAALRGSQDRDQL